jgi:DNA invertase Pin-like site-specific DNA recombinase
MVMEPIKRVGAYIRVSTADQNTDLQAREIREFVESRGWNCLQLYEEKGSGSTSNRSVLKHLLADARQRKLDIIIVWRLDRFARSLKDLILMLQELSELGVAFISLRDQIDLTTATGRLMLHVIGAFSEFESEIIKERVRAGLRNAKLKGKRLGRPVVIDSERVIALRARGHSLRDISRTMGVTRSGVSKSLSRTLLKKIGDKV